MDYKSLVKNGQIENKRYRLKIFNDINMILDKGINRQIEECMSRGEDHYVVYKGDFRKSIGTAGYEEIVYTMTTEQYPETLQKRLRKDYPFCYFLVYHYEHVYISIYWTDPNECYHKCMIF